MTSIVQIDVSQLVAPFPSKLQQTGAIVSQGGTNTTAGTVSFLTELDDLTPLLKGALPLSAMVWASSVVTATTTAPHGFANSQIIPITIAGVTPVGYNGTYNATITGASTFTFPLVASPGSVTVQGNYTPEDVSEVLAAATTYFAQGATSPIFVLELGAGSPAAGVTALGAFMAANQSRPQPLNGDGELPSRFYIYIVPRSWAAEPTFQTLRQSYNNPNSMQYFAVTATLSNRDTYISNLDKSVIELIEAPATVQASEFSIAAPVHAVLKTRPGATNRVAPFAFRFMYGVTPYPQFGNNALLTTLKNDAVNTIQTGAEGGISDTCLYWGVTRDGNPINYWYAIDWLSINAHLQLANAVINGSNNPINPLYYNQDGINRLQAVLGRVVNSGITFGMILGTAILTQLDGPDLDAAIDDGTYENRTIINAIPFIPYSEENPSDYSTGTYNGFTITFVPLRGFEQITVGVTASFFVST